MPQRTAAVTPPKFISVKEVLDAVHKGRSADAIGPLEGDDSVRKVLRRRDEAIERALAGQTLRSLVDNPVSREP